MFLHVHVDYSSGFINVHFPARARYFIYFYGTEWESLVSRIFQDFDVPWRLENVEMDVIFVKNLLIRSVVPFTYGRIKKLFLFNSSCDICVFELFFIPLLYLLIVLSTSFLLYPFYCDVCFKWLSSVYRCSLLKILNALCTSECIADCFCAGCSMTRQESVSMYWSSCTWWLRVLAFFVTRISRKGNLLFFSMSMVN